MHNDASKVKKREDAFSVIVGHCATIALKLTIIGAVIIYVYYVLIAYKTSLEVFYIAIGCGIFLLFIILGVLWLFSKARDPETPEEEEADLKLLMMFSSSKKPEKIVDSSTANFGMATMLVTIIIVFVLMYTIDYFFSNSTF